MVVDGYSEIKNFGYCDTCSEFVSRDDSIQKEGERDTMGGKMKVVTFTCPECMSLLSPVFYQPNIALVEQEWKD